MSIYQNVSAHPSAALSPLAGIVGDVRIGPNVCILAGAQLRGDCGQHIEIGAGSNIQENATIHVGQSSSTVIGKNVTIGHAAILHGCTVEDDALIGMGSIVLDGAHIRSGSLVAAGALVTGGKDFPENSLIMGSPARVVRELSPEEVESMVKRNAAEYRQVATDMLSEGVLEHPTQNK